ncbi:hypothetical protein C0J52_16995 [Blattella germanica]|nr:hypothetical protein C0J52_16995 [Blattella germanica]
MVQAGRSVLIATKPLHRQQGSHSCPQTADQPNQMSRHASLLGRGAFQMIGYTTKMAQAKTTTSCSAATATALRRNQISRLAQGQDYKLRPSEEGVVVFYCSAGEEKELRLWCLRQWIEMALDFQIPPLRVYDKVKKQFNLKLWTALVLQCISPVSANSTFVNDTRYHRNANTDDYAKRGISELPEAIHPTYTGNFRIVMVVRTKILCNPRNGCAREFMEPWVGRLGTRVELRQNKKLMAKVIRTQHNGYKVAYTWVRLCTRGMRILYLSLRPTILRKGLQRRDGHNLKTDQPQAKQTDASKQPGLDLSRLVLGVLFKNLRHDHLDRTKGYDKNCESEFANNGKMMRLLRCHRQRCFFLATRHCHTDVQVDSMIGSSKIKGIPPSSQINPNADKTDGDTSQIAYFKESTTSILPKSYVKPIHSTPSIIHSNVLPRSYTKIAPTELETSDLILQEKDSKEVDTASQREQLLRAALPFDEVPGPKILKMAAKAYSYLPLVGTHVTTAAMMYFLNMIGKYKHNHSL